MSEKIGRCHDCTAPQTEVNMLSRHILELQADKGRLTDQLYELKDRLNEEVELHQHAEDYIKSLEAQIEKMKCCGNCAKRGHICLAEEMQGKLCGKNKDKWELRR